MNIKGMGWWTEGIVKIAYKYAITPLKTFTIHVGSHTSRIHLFLIIRLQRFSLLEMFLCTNGKHFLYICNSCKQNYQTRSN